MSARVLVHRVSPGVSVQDLGRPGYLSFGVSRGGSADVLALHEGAALLGQDASLACLELANVGGHFEALDDCRIALTGAPMVAKLDGKTLVWNTSHAFPKGSLLEIGAVKSGSYGYVHFGGGILGQPMVLGSQSVHFAAGINLRQLSENTELELGFDPDTVVGQTLDVAPRFAGGRVRCVRSLQTDLFDGAQLARFQDVCFSRDARANRMGVGLRADGEGFNSAKGLSILSEVIVPGDIQITGDGMPFVLLCECQTTGGYPRIGSVIPSDLPIVAQAPASAPLQFEFISLQDAVGLEKRRLAEIADLPNKHRPLIRDPRDMPDLLTQQLISGMVTGKEGDAGG